MASDWKTAVHDLAEQVEGWVSASLASNGAFKVHELNMDPTPEEPLLEIQNGNYDVIRLEPAASTAEKLPTNVYLYAYPTLRRAVLVGPDPAGGWDVQSSEGISMNYSWNRGDFVKLLRVLSESHVSSLV